MMSFLFSFLTGPLVTISLKIADLIIERNKANNEVEKARIDLGIQQLQAQSKVIHSAMGNHATGVIYWCLLSLAALGPVAYISKIFLWDKTIGAFLGCSGHSGDINPDCHIFNTDKLGDPNLWWITIAVFGFLFLTSRK